MADSSEGADLRETASGLIRVLPALNRSLDRRADRDFPFPKPPEVQMAMLSLVEAREGITVRAAADALLMRPSNASTLVSQMVKGGLLRREQDALDKRVWHLYVTEETRIRLRDVDGLYCGYVIAGLSALDEDERTALAGALPALRSLARHIHPNLH
ncbi:MarR family winged helix-turn-helix transcriptional regulator [Streptomyces longwoodensis]|uniref:MarR family winged helix-turn-helix transcriptional regulator n=1 Tax=Streptomyces longwoodensis TaxID=68231 RepID=UPI0033E51F05